MARDYEKEAAWAKRKYKRLSAAVEPERYERFKQKLQADGANYAEWLRRQIDAYLAE